MPYSVASGFSPMAPGGQSGYGEMGGSEGDAAGGACQAGTELRVSHGSRCSLAVLRALLPLTRVDAFIVAHAGDGVAARESDGLARAVGETNALEVTCHVAHGMG